MRYAAVAVALAIVVCVAVFGAVLAQRATAPTPSASAPAAVTTTAAVAPAAKPAPPVKPNPAQVVASVPVNPPATPAPQPAPTQSIVAQAPTAQAPTAQPAVPQPAPAQPAAAAPTPKTVSIAAPTPVPVPVPPAPAAATSFTPAPIPPPVPANCPGHPDALGVSRVVEIDTTGGPGFGFEHFKQYDFLQPGEVVLTFDDGPWPHNTPEVLAALANNCTRALFFPIGEHTMWAPEILKQVEAAGHTIGSHTWSHKDLTKLSEQDAKDEIEKGISAVAWGLGHPAAPFFRFPALRHPPEAVTYLGQRNIGIFSTDMDSFDFKIRKPDQVISSVLTKLKKNGKGIILMHDFQRATADAAPELLKQLKMNGYKVVWVKAKLPLTTIASYDEAIFKENKLPTVTNRPTQDVVRTIQ
jgi:peptidoglycan/xylan/chitin deacetylase (PgdA/CDA1 family)